MIVRLPFLLVITFAVLTGCATSQKDELGPELRGLLGIDEKLTETSKEDLEKTFDANTLIRRAETFYSKEEYETALVEYQRFLELHPIDRLANLARFRIGLCYYHQIRSIDRDQEPMQKALNTFQNLVAEAPQSLYAQKSEPYIVELGRQGHSRDLRALRARRDVGDRELGAALQWRAKRWLAYCASGHRHLDAIADSMLSQEPERDERCEQRDRSDDDFRAHEHSSDDRGNSGRTLQGRCLRDHT